MNGVGYCRWCNDNPYQPLSKCYGPKKGHAYRLWGTTSQQIAHWVDEEWKWFTRQTLVALTKFIKHTYTSSSHIAETSVKKLRAGSTFIDFIWAPNAGSYIDTWCKKVLTIIAHHTYPSCSRRNWDQNTAKYLWISYNLKQSIASTTGYYASNISHPTQVPKMPPNIYDNADEFSGNTAINGNPSSPTQFELLAQQAVKIHRLPCLLVNRLEPC